MVQRILIVEDEFFLLESMIKFMGSLENVRTRGAATLGEALRAIDEQPPDLIFSDINLPDGSGLELLSYLSERNLHPPLVFVSAYISDYRDRIPPDSNIMVLEKPISLKRLRHIATQQLEAAETEYVFKLSDYLQIATMGAHTMRLECGDMGTITMVNGALWSAADAHGAGLDAFKRLVVACEVHGKRPRLSCKKADPADLGPQNLEGSMDSLLLNAVFEEEEQRRLGSEPAAEAASDVPFETHLEQGVEHLLNKSYGEALVQFRAARDLKPDHKVVRANIDRLKQLGYGAEEDTP